MTRDHVCFGCGAQVGDGQPHIHVPLDEWAATQGLTPNNLGDLLTFAFCESCIVKTEYGWQPEAHATGTEEPP